ncbi:MAG TPA: ABC transporter permease [Mycobacteriales bacterium]|nr:ABC transporter permease [Mycobacteriales bacterium]
MIGERAILVREQAAGLRPSAYALAKLAVFGVVCAAEAAVLAVGCALVRPVPGAGALLGSGGLELAIALAGTALASCQLSLLCSALVRSTDQVMPVLVLMMALLVLCGGLIPITGRVGVSQLSWLVPARWGYAAGAATADLRRISPGSPADALWRHAPGPWLLSIAILATCVAGATALVAVRLSRIERS